MTLGSLFDGSGTCPLAATMCGIKPVWASEIEPYPHPRDPKELSRDVSSRGHHADQRRGDRAGGRDHLRKPLSGFERGRGAEGACGGQAKRLIL